MHRKRRIFVGDIQGCRPQLDRLLRKLHLRPDDQFFCVGDLVNRGPDSLGTLRRLREIGAKAVLGNHDLYLLQIAAGRFRIASDHALRPVLDAADASDLLHWLQAHPVLHLEHDIVVVHGGLHPSWKDPATVKHEINGAVRHHINTAPDARIEFATRVRHCDPSGRLPKADHPAPGPPFFPWDHFYQGRRTVVFGHWARRGLVQTRHVRGLDTGCVYGGPLTAWIAEEDRFVQAT